MTAAELLNKIKAGLGISGEYQDEILQIYIDEAKAFMISAGVPQSVVESSAAVGCILQGVNDLWTYSSGGVKFSEHFNQRLIQLSMQQASSDDEEFSGSYNDLEDKPSLNGTTIQGDLESDDVGIDEVSNNDITNLF